MKQKKNTKKKIIIIGAGVAGLAAGCYAQMTGFEAHIFEKEPQAGGLCASWKVGDFTINGNLNFLVGSGKGVLMHTIWEELLPINNFSFVDPPYLFIAEYLNSSPCFCPSELEAFEEYFLQRAPEDQPLIEEMLNGARVFVQHDLPIDRAHELATFRHKLNFVVHKFPLLLAIRRWSAINVKQWSESARSRLLARDILQFWEPDMAMIYPLALLGYAHQKAAGYLIGGPQTLIRSLQAQYIALGGNLHTQAEVKHIRTRGKKAIGIDLGKQQRFAGDYIIVCSDIFRLYRTLLQGEYLSGRTLNQLENLRPFAPLFFIAFGLQKGLIHLPPTILGYTIALQTPILSAPNMSVSRLQLHSLEHDSTLAPEGYFLLTLVLPTEFTYWQLLRQNDIAEYEKQKQKIITQVILALENRFPGFASCLVFANAATPATYWRYTYNFQGSYAGWVPTPLALNQYFSRTVEGLENVYIAGHWLQSGGGIPPAVVSARNAVQCICAQEKIPFTTNYSK